FGYDARWWGRSARVGVDELPYWSATRRPLPSLAFVLPLLMAYELGVTWFGGASGATYRTGADAWMRHALTSLNLTDRGLAPLVLVVGLLGWQAVERRHWRVRPGCLVGMALESVLLAVALVGLSRLVDLGFNHLDAAGLLQSPSGRSPAPSSGAMVVGFVGA